MRAAIYNGPHSIEVGERPEPMVTASTDAVVRVVLSCVCGSDLWYWRGESPHAQGPIGHGFIGFVEDIGADVRGVSNGDLVVAPFVFCDGTCPHCLAGVSSQCINAFSPGSSGHDGGQGQAVRVPMASSTLVRVPGSGHSPERMRSLLALSDVMCTGHHAGVSAGVKNGRVVGVVGDGAVGLCAVLAAHRLGAARIVALSRNPVRQALAREFGATEILAERGEAAVPPRKPILRKTTVCVAPARAYIPELLDDVLEGRINPGRVFDFETDLDHIVDAYKAMDERRAIKSLIRAAA